MQRYPTKKSGKKTVDPLFTDNKLSKRRQYLKDKALESGEPLDSPPLPFHPPPEDSDVGRRASRRFKYDTVASRKNKEHNAGFESQTIRDIAEVPAYSFFKHLNLKAINWERRMACKADPLLDLKTYMPNTFYLGFADFHVQLVNEIAERIKYGGKKSLALPRASGKTAICRGMIIYAQKFALRNFMFFIGTKEDKAIQTLEAIKTHWFRNKLLFQDFPEIAYPVYRIEGRSSPGVAGQIYKDERTCLVWGSKEIQTPSMLFTEEDVAGYLEHDPDCVEYHESYNKFTIKSAGCITRVSGIDGSIRGESDIHPILLTQPRPDLILLDDVQKDQTANSPKSCEDMERLIESAVTHLAPPDVAAAIIMPCTVIREGDVSDTYLNRDIKQEWNGDRYGLVKKFPPCIDLENIYEELDGEPNEQGKLWNQYYEVYKESFRRYGNLHLANKWYLENQVILERNFEASWPERFKRSKTNPNIDADEINAIQSLMHWRFTDHLAYLSEGENRPKLKLSDGAIQLTIEEVKERISGIPKGESAIHWTNAVAFLDVQDELLFYNVFAHDMDFNGQFIDYGTWPDLKQLHFRKSQLAGWSLLTREYYRTYPQDKPPNLLKNRSTNIRAPFEAKITHALKQATKMLLDREYPVGGSTQRTLKIRALAIDTHWGEASDTIKKFVNELNDVRVKCYEGHAFLPSHKQLEEYESTPGWLFEHELHPGIPESRWVVKPYSKGGYQQTFILADVNRLKSFLMKRLATPAGLPGAITLYKDIPDKHAMFAMHICSQYPETITARGFAKDCWQPKDGFRSDDDYLDTAVGCLCLASICGASIKSKERMISRPIQTMREVYNLKKGFKPSQTGRR